MILLQFSQLNLHYFTFRLHSGSKNLGFTFLQTGWGLLFYPAAYKTQQEMNNLAQQHQIWVILSATAASENRPTGFDNEHDIICDDPGYMHHRLQSSASNSPINSPSLTNLSSTLNFPSQVNTVDKSVSNTWHSSGRPHKFYFHPQARCSHAGNAPASRTSAQQ